jgi:hypothetical protein
MAIEPGATTPNSNRSAKGEARERAMKPSWWQMFEPIHFDEREEHSLIGGIEPKRETARERARRRWGMEEPEKQ